MTFISHAETSRPQQSSLQSLCYAFDGFAARTLEIGVLGARRVRNGNEVMEVEKVPGHRLPLLSRQEQKRSLSHPRPDYLRMMRPYYIQ